MGDANIDIINTGSFEFKYVHSWENPYISNGLSVMWDGEWNIGGNSHNENPEAWKDLVGTFDATKSGSPTFGSNYTSVNGDGFWLVPESIAPIILSGNLTVEVVFQAGTSTSFNQCVLAFGPTMSTSRILYLFFGNYPQHSNTNLFWTYKGKQAAIRPAGSGAFGTDIHTAAIVVSSGVFNGYFDMTLKTSNNAGEDISSWSGLSQIGKGSQAFDGQIYCIRIYSRPLTELELTSNNAVDKARFNLP